VERCKAGGVGERGRQECKERLRVVWRRRWTTVAGEKEGWRRFKGYGTGEMETGGEMTEVKRRQVKDKH
jgi:hypothetical protein